MFTKNRIIDYRDKYNRIAEKEIIKNNIDEALDALYHSGALQHLFNFELTDITAEKLLYRIAQNNTEIEINNHKTEVLLYDSIAVANIALSTQYLCAVLTQFNHITYLINSRQYEASSELIRMAYNSGKCEVIIIDQNLKFTEQISEIRQIISEKCPKTILLHMSNCDPVGCVAFQEINGCEKFLVNHGDEQFWIGTNVADYVIEFRGMGLDTSVQHRGFKESQCLVNPYYPIIKQDTFQGFDFDIPKDKVVLFSGGRFVKVYAESGRFLDVVRQILEESPTAFYIFAGSGNNKPMFDYIEKYGLGNRWKVISYRSDLLEVMKHVDIYLGTYPQSGGLMSQYAAAAGTPLVEMNTKNGGVTEDLLPRLKDWKITVDDWPAYFEQVRRLVNDAEYRRTFSAAIKESLISEEDFSENLKKILETNTSSVPYVRRETNIELRSSRLLEAENSYLHRVPGIMSNKMILKNYPFTGIYNILQFYRYKNKRS